MHPERMWQDTLEMLKLDKDKMAEGEYVERKTMFMAGMSTTWVYSQALATSSFTQQQFNFIMNLWESEFEKFWLRRSKLFKP